MQRPMGVTIIAVLAIIGGVFGLCGGTVGIVGSGFGGIGSILGFENLHPGVLFWGSLLSLVIGVLDLVFGFGALALRPWAWILGVGLQALSLVENIISFIQGDGRVGATISAIIAAVILAYLFSGTVQRAFGRTGATALPSM